MKLQRIGSVWYGSQGSIIQTDPFYDVRFLIKSLVAMVKEDDEEDVCEFCGGTGEVATDEDDGEGHLMRGVGSQKCICQIKEEEYNDQDK